ncbi:MAG: hypothetical protein CL908_06860 [Deltaproteobacteria bacterium]|jgi:acyl dehydratase|nr:hypothetical protein [Deltaproteobacteria bacterium]
MQGRLPVYGLDLETARPGQILESPHEVTVDSSWRTMWQATFPASSRISTSAEYAAGMGLDEVALPASMLLNMALCFSVEPFSQSCRYHLGLENARQEAPAREGDTFRSFTRLDRMENTSRGDASVIQTTHILVNQHDERVFSLRKRSYYDPIPAPVERESVPDQGASSQYFSEASQTLLERYRGVESFPDAPLEALAVDDVILHPAVRPIGWSENLALSTLYRNTHPVHWDALRYGRDGIVVCGGFVQSLVFSICDRELRQVIDELLECSSHVNTIAPEDSLGAVSRVLSVERIGGSLEAVRVKTLGLKNVAVGQELVGVEIPEALLDDRERRPSEIERICREQCPALAERIAMQAVRTLLRPCS